MRTEQDAFRVLSYEPFPSTAGLSLMIGKDAKRHGGLALAGYRSYRAGDGTLHIAVLHAADCPQLPGFHREPTWMKEAA